MKFRKLAVAVTLLPAALSAQAIEFGNINVTQNDNGNLATSVTLTRAPGSSPGFTILGGNRGDYDISFGSNDDVTGGVMLSSVSQLTRDDTATGDSAIGLFTATSATDFVGSGFSGRYWVPVFRAAQGDEVNISVGCAWFPYDQWLGGFARNAAGTNGGVTDTFKGSPGINLGSQFTTAGGGVFALNLTSLGASAANGVLLVNHGKNEDNYALSRANADGGFSLWVHDNGVDAASYEQDPVAFVYIPKTAVGTKQLVAMGRVNSDATTDVSGGTFTVTKGPTGQWYLSIAGESNTSGVLIISAEGGSTNNRDNIVSYEWDATNSRWVIESRDLSGATVLPGLQNGSTNPEDMFSFAFFRTPNDVPTASINAPDQTVVGGPTDVTFDVTAADTDGTITQVELVRNGVVIATDTTAPFNFTETALPRGRYSYVARVTDNAGGVGNSPAKEFLVSFSKDTAPTNTALDFDGVNDYVTMGAEPELNVGGLPSSAFTLECWFRKEGAGLVSSSGSGGVSAVPLFGKGRGESDGANIDCNIFFGINTAGKLVADFESMATGANYPITASNTPITNSAWHHAAVTFDGQIGQWKLYLDGVEVGSSTISLVGAVPRYDSIQHFAIGTALNSTGVRDGAFAGVIDEARVWSYARSASEIAAAKDLELSDADGLLGRFGLNEGFGTNTSSSAGSSLGVLTNGPMWVEGFPTAVTNAAPAVALTAPVGNASSYMPYSVAFAAEASDTDGSIAKVEFRVNGETVGEDATAPFTMDWAPSAIGSYVVTARAIDNLGGSKVSVPISFTIETNPNQAPAVTLGNPPDGTTIPGRTVTLEANISDPENDATTVTFYGREAVPTTPGPDFTVVAIPDTQYYSEGNPTKAANWGITVDQLVGQFGAQTQWIVDNKDTRNVAFVAHMGDIVENGNYGGNPIQWDRASAAMGKLEDPITTLRTNGIPYGIAPGNHDIDPIGSYDTGSTAFYNQYFGISRFAGRSYYGGNYGSDNTNSYQLFSASGLDFISIHMSYDTTPNQAILDWADALLKAYPNRRAIITSHYIIGSGNPASFSTQGSAIYENLKDNPNLFLMLCGHIHAEGFRQDTYQGHTVYSILSDYQGLVNGGNGLLRTLTFSPANNRIRIESWSPTLNRAASPADGLPHLDGTYDLSYNMQAAATGWVPLGTVNLPAGQSLASVNWSGLNFGKGYEWYAAVSDGVNSVGSTTRTFNTPAPAGPTVALVTPVSGDTASSPATIHISATASDSDGSVARVEFYNGGTKLGEDITAPYEFDWIGVQPGSYSVTAQAIDDSALSAVSSAAAITVTLGDHVPTVVMTSPAANALIQGPTTVTLAADAVDNENAIVKVEFFSGTVNPVLLGEDATAPYSLELPVGPGNYIYSARVTDNVGQAATSASVKITVFAEAPVPNATHASVGTFDLPTWTIARTSPAPYQFNLPGTDVGDLELKINGTAVPFNNGIALATNWAGPQSGGALAAMDNLCQPYANVSGNTFVSVLDNSNSNAVGANPSTVEETAGISVAFLPYADGWTGADVLSDGNIRAGNLPAGVTVSLTGTGTYTINGLSVAGNLLAFTNGDTGTLADNVCSVRIVNNSWVIDTRDNAGGTQSNEFSFVYLPPSTAGVFAAKISSAGVVGNLNVSASALGVTATNEIGGMDITFGDGTLINPASAAIFVTADASNGAGSSAAVDNLISWSASGNSFRVFTQDLEGVNGSNEAIDLRIVAIPYAPFSSAVPLPQVTIAASDASAGEYGSDQALEFSIARSGPTVDPLTVPLVASGSATEGADYTGFQPSLVIPAGQASQTLPLAVKNDDEAEGLESVTLALGSDSGFIAGVSSSATAGITDRPAQGFFFTNIPDAAKRGSQDDADDDGQANVVEYFMGTQPADGSSCGVVKISAVAASGFKVHYNRAKNRGDVHATIEWSTDPTNWHASGTGDGERTVNFTESVVAEPAADVETVEATGSIDGTGTSKIFVRLSVK